MRFMQFREAFVPMRRAAEMGSSALRAARHLNPLSIVVANRLLSRSVIRKIERPLNELLAGAREVASGNLGYRIYEIFR